MNEVEEFEYDWETAALGYKKELCRISLTSLIVSLRLGKIDLIILKSSNK